MNKQDIGEIYYQFLLREQLLLLELKQLEVLVKNFQAQEAGGGGLASGLKNLGGGLATGTTGTVGAGLAVAGGALAGGAMAVKGGMDIYNDFANNQVSGKTALSAGGAIGGAVGAGALIALGASNPVGWVALAVGGLALAGRAAWEYAEYCEKSTDATEELQKATNAEIRQKQDKDKKEELLLANYQERIKQSGDFETAKKLAIEAGITTEKEMQQKEIDSMEALQALTDEYIRSRKKLNEDTTQYLKNIKGVNDQQQKDYNYLEKVGRI